MSLTGLYHRTVVLLHPPVLRHAPVAALLIAHALAARQVVGHRGWFLVHWLFSLSHSLVRTVPVELLRHFVLAGLRRLLD